MIDIHNHILYGIDDGAQTLETSLEMLKIAEGDGTKIMIATPHYYRGRYENKFETVLELCDALDREAKNQNINIKILPGQEILLDKNTAQDYKNGLVNGLNNTRYILVELPMDTLPKDALDNLYELQVLGLTPILAHPERYRYTMERPNIIDDFAKEGCLFQLNTGSIIGLFGKTVQKTSETLLRHGLYSFIGSDAHSSGRRCPGLSSGIKLSGDIMPNFKEYHETSTDKLLKNEEMRQIGKKIETKKSIFSFFKK